MKKNLRVGISKRIEEENKKKIKGVLPKIAEEIPLEIVATYKITYKEIPKNCQKNKTKSKKKKAREFSKTSQADLFYNLTREFLLKLVKNKS